MAKTCLISSVESDSHMWNLVYMQLFLEEKGFTVNNLGCCVPADIVIDTAEKSNPDLVLISSVNGHGFSQGKELMEKAAHKLTRKRPKMVIGGKLSVQTSDNAEIEQQLQSAGYDGVFTGDNATQTFSDWLAAQTFDSSFEEKQLVNG